jgi:hypothetical protein
MNVFLLEINNSPSLAPHTKLENIIKKSVINNLFNLVDIQSSQIKKVKEFTDYYWPKVEKYNTK